jgi:acyl-CoA reductase-like NAD-dependent aldehyde dehydrogenase
MEIFDTYYCDGRWVPVRGHDRLAAEDPQTERPFASIAICTAAEVDAAVAAARRVFDGWSTTPVADRCAALKRLGAGLARQAEEFAADLLKEVGVPLWVSRQMQVPMPLRNLELAIEAISAMSFEDRVAHSLVVREPIGVVAAITPWNFPLHQIVAKVGAALAAGCTVVLKPSELAPLVARRFARIVHEAGFPPGVFNLVWGNGPDTGAALAAHPDVDMVSFTGSISGGRAVAHAAAETIKKVALELGGKSATILLDDAPLADAVQTVLRQCFTNSGQICAAQTRLLVPHALMREVEAICKRAASEWTVGDPSHPDTRLGVSSKPCNGILPPRSTKARSSSQAVQAGRLVTTRAISCDPPCSPASRWRCPWRMKRCLAPCSRSCRTPTKNTPFRSRTERRTDCPAGCSVRLHGARLRLPGVCARGRS